MYRKISSHTFLVSRVVRKIDETVSFTVIYIKGRGKPIPLRIQDKKATANEKSPGTPEIGTSANGVARKLNILHSTVKKLPDR